MIKTAQDAYLAGRQAALEKLAVSGDTLMASAPAASILLGTGIGTYRGGGDSDALIRAAKGSLIGTALGALGGAAVGVPLSMRSNSQDSNIISTVAGSVLGGILGGAINPGTTTGLKTTKDLPTPVRKTVEKVAPQRAPEVSYKDSYLGLGGALAAAGLGGYGASELTGNPLLGTAVGAGILGAYTPTLLGAHRAKKMLEREGLSPEEINRRAPEINAFSPIGNLATTAVGAGIGGAIGAGLAQLDLPMYQDLYKETDEWGSETYNRFNRGQSRFEEKQKELIQGGAGIGGLLGLGYGLYKDYANPMNEAKRIIDEAKAAR
jgi:hypothetical protein